MAVNTEEISALVARVLEESTPRTIELVTEKLQSGKIKVKKAISLPEAIDIALSKSKTKSQSFYCVSHGKHFGKILAYRGVAKTLYEFYDNIYICGVKDSQELTDALTQMDGSDLSSKQEEDLTKLQSEKKTAPVRKTAPVKKTVVFVEKESESDDGESESDEDLVDKTTNGLNKSFIKKNRRKIGL